MRATCAVQDAMTGDREHGVLLKDRENALRVASIIEMLRADDEGLEEVQNLPQLQNDKKFETRLVDERVDDATRRASASIPHRRSARRTCGGPGAAPTQDAGALMNRAQLLKEHYRSQPDPRGEALEVGVAFAEAAAAAHREANRRLVGNVEGDCPEDELVAHLEKEARDFLRMACGKSDVKQVLRRACSISACREIVRKRRSRGPRRSGTKFWSRGSCTRASARRKEGDSGNDGSAPTSRCCGILYARRAAPDGRRPRRRGPTSRAASSTTASS